MVAKVTTELAAHIINMAQYLVGEIQTVFGDMAIVVKKRPEETGSGIMVAVENEDQAQTMVRFNSGARHSNT